MAKWDHLTEGDASLRAAARAHKSSPTDDTALAYAREILRAPPRNTGVRFERLLDEYRGGLNRKTAAALILDYDRVIGAKDSKLSQTCELMGKIGSTCKQANQTAITTKYFVILVSYRTPVAYRVLASGDEFYTKERHSRTTSAHIKRWTNFSARAVSQRELDEIYRAIR